MATKKAKRTAKPVTGKTFEMLHAACLAAGNEREWDYILRELAATFGVPLKEAKQRAYEEGWELERNANQALSWLAMWGHGTEAEFMERWLALGGGRPRDESPEGARWSRAQGRETWVRQQTHIAQWEAFAEERAARAAYEAFLERQRCQCHREARAA